ncbi:Hypothetical protein PHPALM_15970 [Phytophthora palmivora]|uniref:Jacalin-type lectin domain-containing protein n=1 Tax=Phytophthora palmivora TaxID=4796 RepID=A0A2P4XQU6_9STRA|nr:Hypothetical protein PHPALM_15970 [Phytophthora palmivora]
MRLLHLLLTTAVTLVSVSNGTGITIAATTAMKSDAIHDTAFGGQIVTRELRGAALTPAMMRRRPDSSPTEAPTPTPTPAPLPPGAYLGKTFGGPHGKDFSDSGMVKSGQKVLSVSIRSHKRVDAVSLNIVNPSGEETTLYHGGNGGEMNTTALAEGEHITDIEANWGKELGHTRVKYIKFTTNLGKIIEGGRHTDSVGVDNAKEGYQLGGFVGRSGDEVDMVGAIWTSIQPVV